MGILRFSLLGFPIEVQPGFWLLAAFLGMDTAKTPAQFGVWIAVVLSSFLVHELGHATVARAFGQSPRIALYMMGGVTVWAPTRDLGRWRRIAVTLAGPFAGFALAALAGAGFVLSGANHGAAGLHVFALRWLLLANLFWSALNLVPVLPFDGGQVMAAALGPSRQMLAASLSLVFGLALAYFLWTRYSSVFGALIFAYGAISSFLAVRRGSHAPPPPVVLDQVLMRARAALAAGDYEQAAAIARAVHGASSDSAVAREAMGIVAWAGLGKGDVAAARDALREAPRPVDPFLEGAVHEADGDLDRAAAVLAAARERGDERPELAALLVKTLLGRRRFEEAARVAGDLVGLVPDTELRQVASTALDGHAAAAAARIWLALFEREHEAGDAWDAARALVRAGQRDAAIEALARAVDAGETQPDRARVDPDLALLSGDPRFETVLRGDPAPP